MNDKQIKIGSVLAYVQMALNVVVGLVYTPLMIKLLGKSEYGLYNTVASTISMLSILNLGFSSSYIKNFSRYKAKNDKDAIFKLNGLLLLVFIIIGIIALVCGSYLTLHLEIVFDNGLTKAEFETAKVLMMLLTINLTLSFPMSVFSTIISANERFVFLKLIGMGKTVGSPLITIPLLLMGKGSVAIVVVTLLVSVIVDTINVIYVIGGLHNRFIFHDFEKGLFKSIFGYTLFIAINIVIDQINWNIDKVLLGRYKGTVAVAVYSVGATLQTYYQMFSTAISGIFTPKIHHIINSELSDAEKNWQTTSLFVKIGRIQFLILGFVCLEMIYFGKEFIYFWAGEGFEQAYAVALLLIIPVTIPLIQNLGIEIQRALNKHKFRSIAYAFMAIINLILSIYLCQRYGPVGAAVGTTISLVLANGLVMNIYYHKKCGIDIIVFWENIGRMSLGMLIPALVGILLKSTMNFYSIGNLIIGIAILALLYSISIYWFSMNNEERTFVKSAFYKVHRG